MHLRNPNQRAGPTAGIPENVQESASGLAAHPGIPAIRQAVEVQGAGYPDPGYQDKGSLEQRRDTAQQPGPGREYCTNHKTHHRIPGYLCRGIGVGLQPASGNGNTGHEPKGV